MTLYIENSEYSTKKLLEMISEFGKVTEYLPNMQKKNQKIKQKLYFYRLSKNEFKKCNKNMHQFPITSKIFKNPEEKQMKYEKYALL